MLRKINVFTDKTLKLSNVVITPIKPEDCKNIDTCINKIENFIKSKGSLSLGPLIQKIEYYVNEDGNLDVNVFIMRQINNFIHNIEPPYTMESVLRVKNCMYARLMRKMKRRNKKIVRKKKGGRSR